MTNTLPAGRPHQVIRRTRRGRVAGLAVTAATVITVSAGFVAGAVAGVVAGPAFAAPALPVPLPVPLAVRALALPAPVGALTSARDGSLWAAERSPADLVHISGSGPGTTVEHVPLPGGPGGATPATSLAARTGTSVWFARPDSGTVGWTEPGGTEAGRTVHELAVGGSPRWVAADGAGGVWVLDPATATLQRRDVTGDHLATVDVGSISAETVSVALDPLATDGAGQPWVARRTSSTEIGHRRVDGSFVWSVLPTPSRNYPLALAAGPDGAMWGTAQSEQGGLLFRAGDTGAAVVRTFPGLAIGSLVTGPDGNLWTSLATAGTAGTSAAGRFVRIDPTGGVLQQLTAPTGSGAAEHLAATPAAVTASLPNGTTPTSVELPIATAYQRLGAARSVLGLPRGAEQPVPAGWARDFAGGRMLWSPATGAHEVHGAILARYLAFGADRSLFGLPVSDEYAPAGSSTPERPVRASRFAHGMMLWSPRTGAHEVHGLILARYEQLGGPAGRLGLPVSDELTVGPGVKESRFEHGVLRWSAGTGVLLRAP